jgi:hypothetical protein
MTAAYLFYFAFNIFRFRLCAGVNKRAAVELGRNKPFVKRCRYRISRYFAFIEMSTQRGFKPVNPYFMPIVQIGENKQALTRKMAIERHLGHFRRFNQRIHPRRPEARGIKQIVRRE